MSEMNDRVVASLISILPAILVIIIVVILLTIFRKEIRQAASGIAWRVKSGAHVKVASFELGSTYINPQKGEPLQSKLIEMKSDKKHIRYNERAKYYLPNRDIFLVHTINPSSDPNELYDIRMYLVPHKSATLTSVQRVEYYFGKYWKDRIFVATNRSNGFLVSTSAYGPFVCTAEVHFSDGEVVMLSRYIDFEMGQIGRA
jgi:hypothetical protein